MKTLTFETERRTQLLDATAEVRAAVAEASGDVVTVFVPHTTAGILVQASGEGAIAVVGDLERALERLVDERWEWQHTQEGDRNPWSHVRAALTSTSVTIPIVDGEIAIGDLQTIFLCEFDGPRRRKLFVAVY